MVPGVAAEPWLAPVPPAPRPERSNMSVVLATAQPLPQAADQRVVGPRGRR
jgi:hypothetical protein